MSLLMKATVVDSISNEQAQRDIEQAMRRLSDIAAKVSRAKASYTIISGNYNFIGYIDISFKSTEDADGFNPYTAINALSDAKSALPKWSWGIGGFNYKRINDVTWRINIGRFST